MKLTVNSLYSCVKTLRIGPNEEVTSLLDIHDRIKGLRL